MGLPLDGYVRVSRVGARTREDGFISPDIQEQGIREWADRVGLEVVMRPHELNVSGGTMDRPVFNQIMDRVRSGQSGGFVVYKLDRFARTVLGALKTISVLGEHNATFSSATQPELDYSTPSGRAFVHQLFVWAEYTRDSLAEGWEETNHDAVMRRGIHISPGQYLGYTKQKGRPLIPNEQAQLAVEMFERAARRGEGDSETWGGIAAWLDESAPLAGGKLWTYQRVQGLCASRVYRGEASRCIHQDVHNRGPQVNPKAHPPLVSEELWQAAQKEPRTRRGGRKDGEPLSLLSEGLLRCAGCRFGMSIQYGPNGERMYSCRGKHASGRCPQTAGVLAEVIETYIEDCVLAEIEGLATFVPDSSEREQAMAQLEAARSDLDGFRRDRAARRTLGEAQWNEWLEDYVDAVRAAEATVDQLDLRLGAATQGLTREHYLALPQDERREVLAGFMDCAFVRRSRGRGRNVDPIAERTRILWRGQAPADLPRQRRASAIIPFDFEADVESRVVAA